MIIKTFLVILVMTDILILYKLSVAIDRVEDDIVDIEITYTKLQDVLRDMNDMMILSRCSDRDKLPFE
jgi:hypothetical protein